jgi:hypothetical protein
VFENSATAGMSGRRRLVAVGMLVLAASVVGAWVAADKSGASGTSLGAIVLRPSQIGDGYRSAVVPDGQKVAGQVTLDLCYYTFPSEAYRTARLQLAYAKSASAPAISNEVVTYGGNGAAIALQELRQAVKDCPSTPRKGPAVSEQKPVTWHLTAMTEPGLTGSYIAVRANVSALVDGKTRSATTFAIYQFSGNTMSGVYGYGSNPAATLALTVHAAQQSARNLG